MTVGDAIEGAATTTTDSARQVAALVSNQPSHNTTQGGSNMSHHLEQQQQEPLAEPFSALDSSEVEERDAGDDGWEQFPRRSARRDAKKRKHAGPRACEFRGVKSWGGWWWASYGSSVRSYERKLDAARAYDMMARGAGAPHPNPNLPLDAAQRAFEAAELRGAAADEPRRAKKPRLR